MSDQENWNDQSQNEENVGDKQGGLSRSSRVVIVQDLHEREECGIEVSKHVESNVNIESELNELLLSPTVERRTICSGLLDDEDSKVGNEDQDQEQDAEGE